MRNNRTLRSLVVLLVCLLFIGGIADAQSLSELRQKMDKAEQYVKQKEKEHKDANDHLNKQIGNFIRLHGHLVSIELPSQSPATNYMSLTAKLAKIVEKLIQANLLTSVMQGQLDAIETQRGTCNTLWADVQLAQTAYENAIDAYNAEAPPDEQVGTVVVPQPPPVAKLYLCPGPCDTKFTTKVLADTTHKVFCQEPPHQGTNKYSYYSCPPDYENLCAAKAFHQTPCRGGCGTLFAKNTGTRPRADDVHRKQCDERTSRNVFNFWTGNCIGDYYNCNGQTSADCWNVGQHLSDSNPPSQGSRPPSTSPSEPTDNTPNCQDCTSDCSSPCSCSNSGTCGGTVVDNTPNCQDCTSHCSSPCRCSNSGTCNGTVSSPPSGSNPPSNTPPSGGSNPPAPTTVICGANGWTGCTVRSSDGKKCYVPPCGSGCGSGHWSCNPDGVAWHAPGAKECRRSGCGNTWKKCQKTPWCKKLSGKRCWAR